MELDICTPIVRPADIHRKDRASFARPRLARPTQRCAHAVRFDRRSNGVTSPLPPSSEADCRDVGPLRDGLPAGTPRLRALRLARAPATAPRSRPTLGPEPAPATRRAEADVCEARASFVLEPERLDVPSSSCNAARSTGQRARRRLSQFPGCEIPVQGPARDASPCTELPRRCLDRVASAISIPTWQRLASARFGSARADEEP
jgi:hypothetical protein